MSRAREAVVIVVEAIAKLDEALCKLPSADPDYDRLRNAWLELRSVAHAIDARCPLVEKRRKPVTS